ncbi:hypothetical protein CHLRE_03g149700v5 [Chlamydomonas reinhardtii]|uniref:Uncharacterized protein n=1 Tax=Chlamydomonas reinhardtii TaxID=3055 RepID=A0A2K3DVL7_CHLRE|nr:uncharacterized protein CHLRE_03g149700v5 [Chlamydomonas reinhardtii]PNW84577.1 hypothetical protein CHLRE_03g149700v5 [Chlamydomonas reinhardtii]
MLISAMQLARLPPAPTSRRQAAAARSAGPRSRVALSRAVASAAGSSDGFNGSSSGSSSSSDPAARGRRQGRGSTQQPRPAATAAAKTSGTTSTHTSTSTRSNDTTAPSTATATGSSSAAPLTFSSTSTYAQAAASSAAKAAAQISAVNRSTEVAVWISDRPLRRLPASLADPHQLEAAARRLLPGYGGARSSSAPEAHAREVGEVLAADGLPVDFSAAERAFLRLLAAPDLDGRVARFEAGAAEDVQVLERAAAAAAARAYGALGGDGSLQAAACHTFLQRLLYRMNRLNHFWYDDLRLYDNERSAVLAALRERVEGAWQRWEAAGGEAGAGGGIGVSPEAYKGMSEEELIAGVRARAAVDVDPPPSPAATYVRDHMGLQGYKHLLAVGSLDGLVEASRQSRVCAGAANEVAATVFKVLMEEYGGGKLSRKHSTFYASMMSQLGLDTRLEAYFDLLPWQWLAGANHNFLLTERRRHYLRYCGGLTYFEVNGPSVYRTYCAAAQRLGLPATGWGYWELHVREDERHGRQMVEEVAVPLIARYGAADGWEVLWGYDQEVAMSGRAAAALVADIRAAAAEEQGVEGQQ